MYKYKYVGKEILAFTVDDQRYEVGVHKNLPMEIELPKKVNIPGLELVEKDGLKRKSKPKDYGGE